MKKWTEYLDGGVYERLCNCTTVRSDVPMLAQAKWNVLKQKEGFTPEDALVAVLELLDENGRYFDMTIDEYNDILNSIV